MYLKQLTVFVENRSGRMEEIADIMRDNQINIISLSVSDTSEYGLVRMIVSKTEQAADALRSHGFSAAISEIVAVRLQQQVGTMSRLFRVLSGAGLNLEYMYPLITGKEGGAMAIKTSDPEKTLTELKEAGMDIFGQKDLEEEIGM